jgi:hypothetical protein
VLGIASVRVRPTRQRDVSFVSPSLEGDAEDILSVTANRMELTQVTITIYAPGAHPDVSVQITEEAAKLANISFNPTQDETILALKTLAAAFHTLCFKLAEEDGASAREAAIARTQMQTAAMFAVQAKARSF